jgi:hypothetical protein
VLYEDEIGGGMWHTWGEVRNACKILDRIPKGKGTLGRCVDSLEDAIKIELKELGWEECTLDLSSSR